MDLMLVLTKRFEGSEWVLSGETYDGLEWLSETPKPSQVELESLWAEVQAEILAEKQALEDARQSAIAKLEALGLTVDEVKVAFGLEA